MRAARRKVMVARTVAAGSPSESTKGYTARQHQDVVPSTGQGPQGNVGTMVPFGATPPVPPPPVGAGKGFKGW